MQEADCSRRPGRRLAAAGTWPVAPEIKGRDDSGSALEAKLMDVGPREEGGESQRTHRCLALPSGTSEVPA